MARTVRAPLSLPLQFEPTPHLVARVGHEGREQDGVHPDSEQQERACDEADAKEQQSAIAQRLGLCRVGLLV